MARKFEYHGSERTVESALGRKGSGGYDGYLKDEFTMMKLPVGERTIRILPPTWTGDPEEKEKWGNHWDIRVFVHYSVGPDNATYLCPEKMQGERCPICEARLEATDEKEAKGLRAGERHLVWAIDRANAKAGPQIVSMPNQLFGLIVDRAMDKSARKVMQIDHPEKGYDVTFTREGTDVTTKYSREEVARDPSPLSDSDKEMDRWINYIMDHPLPSVLNYYPTDYLEKVLKGGSPKSAARSDDRDRSSARGPVRKLADDDDDDEDRGSSRDRSSSRDREPPWEDQVRPSLRRGSDDDDDRGSRRKLAADDDDDDRSNSDEDRRARSRDDDDDDRRRRPRDDDEGNGEDSSATARRGMDRLREQHARGRR